MNRVALSALQVYSKAGDFEYTCNSRSLPVNGAVGERGDGEGFKKGVEGKRYSRAVRRVSSIPGEQYFFTIPGWAPVPD